MSAAKPLPARKVLVVDLEGDFKAADIPSTPRYTAALQRDGATVSPPIGWKGFNKPGVAARLLGDVDALLLMCGGFTAYRRWASEKDEIAHQDDPPTPFVTTADETGAALRVWVDGGGVCVAIAPEDRCNSLANLFGKTWTYDGYERSDYMLSPTATYASVFSSGRVPLSFSVKSTYLGGVPPSELVYGCYEEQCAIACGSFGTGCFAIFADVNGEAHTISAVAALVQFGGRAPGATSGSSAAASAVAVAGAGPARPAADAPALLCDVCSKSCITRCSRCKVWLYCGVGCQRQDWQMGHREACIPAPTAAT